MTSRTSGSVSTDDSEMLMGRSTHSKENQDSSNAGGIMSTTDPALLDLLGTTKKVRSPTRSLGSRNSRVQTGSVTSANVSRSSHHKDTISVPSADSSGGVRKKSTHFNASSSYGHISAAGTSITTASASDVNFGAMSKTNTAKNSNSTSKTPHSGLTIKVGSNNSVGNHLIKMNPRDQASPRRNRTPTSKSKAYKEYEHAMAEIQVDSISLNSWKEGGGGASGSNASISRNSASAQSSSVGGLAFIETPIANQLNNTNQLDYKKQYHPPHVQNQYHPTNAASSVSSKSTNSKRSRQSKSSRATNQSSSQRIQYNNLSNKNPSESNRPAKEEQILFEQRLCDEGNGVAVRKIHSNGKSQLRFVKCVPIPKDKISEVHSNPIQTNNMSNSLPPTAARQRNVSSARSVTSLLGRIAGRKHKSSIYGAPVNDDSPQSQRSKSIHGDNTSINEKRFAPDDDMFTRALAWGNKKKVMIPLCKFVAVRKGKTTKRTRRNACEPSRLLSLVTHNNLHGSLDIEAPTTLDRDKFAMAFSVFLKVPLEDDLLGENVFVKDGKGRDNHFGSSESYGDDESSMPSTSSSYNSYAMSHGMEYRIGADGPLLPNLTQSPANSIDEPQLLGKTNRMIDDGDDNDDYDFDPLHENTMYPDKDRKTNKEEKVVDVDSKLLPEDTPTRERRNKGADGDDDASEVSSLTQGFDQEIIEELHQAIEELRAELDASRAEAARAVKVAEQAIQSAESCSSSDWNSTVTHKAAEAAAQAQKRSAEAIKKQRLAEEKLAAEKKSASFWRKQAQVAEEDIGALQTRLAVAEIERASMTEELESQKKKAASYIQTFKRDYAISESIQRETLANASEQNKLLEIELDGTRRDLAAKAEEVKLLQDSIGELQNEMSNVSNLKTKKKFFGMSKKSRDGDNSLGRLLQESQTSSTGKFIDNQSSNGPGPVATLPTEQLLKIHAQTAEMRKQFELLRRTTLDELKQLPYQANDWASVASKALSASQNEVAMLKTKLALEMANRRKLLGEVQDLRGAVRVYCRPRPIAHSLCEDGSLPINVLSVVSNEVGLLHREKVLPHDFDSPMSFDFDRMFPSNSTQIELYAEMEELALSSLDGYNSCIFAFGQNGCGKTHSLIGDFSFVKDEKLDGEANVDIVDTGIHLLAMQQLFTVSKTRQERFQDTFSLTIMEIYDEKLIDLAAETDMASSDPKHYSITSDSKNEKKLEIKTNLDGETIVQGLVSVPVKSYNEVETLWKQSLVQRAKRAQQLGKSLKSYEASTNLIATLHVVSTNSVTGVGTTGRVQFVDLAASDVTPRRGALVSKTKTSPTDNVLASIGNKNEWKYANRSITQLTDVVNSRCQFSRSVPYRNATLTHLLQDSLEADTKVVLLACVSSDAKDLQNTANTMRFASKMRKMLVGKATKHTISFA